VSVVACNAAEPSIPPANSVRGAARTTSSYSVVYSFRGEPDGYVPTGGLISNDSGRLYGVTYYGGATARGCNGDVGCGTFFMFDPSSRRETVLYSFGRTRDDGQLPNSLLLYHGSFYGTTQVGGTTASLGTVFKITPPARAGGKWNETILHRFHGSPNDGSDPSQLTIDASGSIYGTAGEGGSATKCFLGCGAIFKLTPPPAGNGEWHETILHSFAGAPDDGAAPFVLILGPNGTFYGETDAGGRSAACGDDGCGTVFALTASHGSRWTEMILHAFKARNTPKNDGEFPNGGLPLTSNGALYGVTAYGGRGGCTQGPPWLGCGTFFLLKPSSDKRAKWTESILYFFKGGASDGGIPDGITSEGRSFYGTTVDGGGGYCERGAGCGTLFSLTPSRHHTKWTETVAHKFSGGTTDGWDPSGPVIAEGGGLYGVTMYGGAYCTFGCGTIYELQP
jgi:uncharacterized repeat protein (TIGR03803 family)